MSVGIWFGRAGVALGLVAIAALTGCAQGRRVPVDSATNCQDLCNRDDDNCMDQASVFHNQDLDPHFGPSGMCHDALADCLTRCAHTLP